jgi:tryptophan synthase alpha chain
MADGPVIQESSRYALAKGVNLKEVLRLVGGLRKKTDIPIAFMTYYNPVFSYGLRRFIRDAVGKGVDAVIIPDLPADEGCDFMRYADRQGLDVVGVISPTTCARRVKFIDSIAKGFIYYVSLTGVTGARSSLPAGLIKDLKDLKKRVSLPVCVGFGISSNAQVRQLSKACDGVIVGSAIIKKIRQNLKRPDLVKKVLRFVATLKG